LSAQAIRFTDLQSYAGRFLGTSGRISIDQAQTDQFAVLTGDDEWIHVDIDQATRERGGAIVHGYTKLR
jgi:acyl dehydratase